MRLPRPVMRKPSAMKNAATIIQMEELPKPVSASFFAAMVPVLGEPVTPLRRYYSDSRMRTMRVLRANYLATINDLPKAVEKTADKTMKVIYTLRRGA